MSAKKLRRTINLGSMEIALDGRSGERAFIIAEIGINHNGSFDRARELIDIAKKAGVQAVKFQKRNLDELYQRKVLQHLDQFEQAFQYLIPILKDCELSDEELWKLQAHAESQDLLFLCTPFDISSAEFLNELGVPAFKVSSADLTNFVLIETLVGFKKPIIISTGMSSDIEVDLTVEFLERHRADFALLHCVSSYPVNPADAKLYRIRQMLEKYQCPVGYSGHDMGVTLSIAARTLGASIIEKHVTTDRSLRGPDHKVSLTAAELRQLVVAIRETEDGLFERSAHLLPGEVLNQMVFRKSIVAAEPIRRGQAIKREMLAVKSPGTGLSVQMMPQLIGRTAPRDFAVDDIFLDSDLEGRSGKKPFTPLDWGKWGLVVRYHDFENALPLRPEALEFHFTYQDTTLDVPHQLLKKHEQVLKSTILRVHCCEYVKEELFDLCSDSDEVLERSVATLQRVINITRELSVYFSSATPMIVFNCGAMSLEHEIEPRKINSERFYAAVRSLDTEGVLLLAQNMPPNPWYFGGQWKGHYFLQPHELTEFCRNTGHFICLDLSHAHMACVATGIPFGEYIADLKPYVRHIHLADARSSEGEGLQIGLGEINFKDFFQRYADYTGTWIPEIWLGHVNDNYRAKIALELLSHIHQESVGAASKRTGKVSEIELARTESK